jgi:hypothetical protein
MLFAEVTARPNTSLLQLNWPHVAKAAGFADPAAATESVRAEIDEHSETSSSTDDDLSAE